MTSEDDTLIITTSDHAHAMMYNGYPKRGNDILDYANGNAKTSLYETLIYATGPGYFYHKANDTNSTNSFMPLENLSSQQRKDPLYMHQSLIPMEDAVHGGEDVGVFSRGPNAFLLQRTFEQSYIAYAISYAACIGPVSHMNPSCSGKNNQANTGDKLKVNNVIFLILLYNFFVSIRKLLQ